MTRNLSLAAFLELRGYNVEVSPIPGDERGLVEFWVKVDDELDDIVEKFYNREAVVEPREYSFMLKSVKDKKYLLNEHKN